MSKIDIALIVVVLIGGYKGYRDGFLMGLFTFVALVLGVFGAFKLMGAGMVFLQEHFNADRSVLPYLSFAAIFIIIMVLVTWLGKLLRQSIDKTFLGRLDEIMGCFLGAFKTLFVASILFWLADSLKISPPEEWTEGAWLYPFTAHLAPELAGWLAQFLPFLKEIFPVF